MRAKAVLLCLLSATLFANATPLPGEVRSPWTGNLVRLTAAPAACAVSDQVGPDLVMDGFYRTDDPTHSVVDPERMRAYTEAARPAKSAALAIVESADRYRTTGSGAAAQCTIRRILTLVHSRAMTGRMSSSQSYYVQGWLAGAIAIAYLKVRDAGLQTAEQHDQIAEWLELLGRSTRTWYDAAATRHPEGNNHLYWAGVQLAATAAVTNSNDDLQWAYRAYRNGIAQVDAQGMLPLELARGGRALHYHLYALAPLVMIAEFGQSNDTDLFAEKSGALRRLAAFSIAQVFDPSLLQARTGVAQENARPLSGDAIGWAPPVVQRFQIAGLATLVAQAPSLSVFYLGGLPPGSPAAGARSKPRP